MSTLKALRTKACNLKTQIVYKCIFQENGVEEYSLTTDFSETVKFDQHQIASISDIKEYLILTGETIVTGIFQVIEGFYQWYDEGEDNFESDEEMSFGYTPVPVTDFFEMNENGGDMFV